MTDKKESFGPGLVLKYTYPTQAAAFRVEVTSSTQLRFQGLEGPVKGVDVTVSYARTDVTPGVALLTWEEENGAVMVMVVNLIGLKVHAREVREGKLLALNGTVEVVSSVAGSALG